MNKNKTNYYYYYYYYYYYFVRMSACLKWKSFCKTISISPFNPSEASLCLFVVLSVRSVSIETVRNSYLAGITNRDVHLQRALKNPFDQRNLLDRAMKELSISGNQLRALKPFRRSISTQILSLIKPFIDFSSHDQRCL